MHVLLIPSLMLFGSAVCATPIHRHVGETLVGHYIVKLKLGTNAPVLLRTAASINITHQWDTDVGFNGFAGQVDEATLRVLQDSPAVELIAEDGYVSLADSDVQSDISARSSVTQPNAPWNLARISSITPPSAPDYNYDSSAGQGSDIYLLDTGVYVQHSEFGGRARQGPSYGGSTPSDGNGHGTHTAGVAIGTRYGVAKLANLISIKVLNDIGTGSIADIISGMNWAVTNARSSGRPSSILLPIGGSASSVLDNAVASAVGSGITVSVTAGSSNADASGFSPARAPSAITVAASTAQDTKTSFSNFGSVVDIFAPGENIIGPTIGSPTATTTLSGTAAVAHVAGVIAYYQGLYPGIALSPAQIRTLLLKHCPPGAITGVPAGTTNCLVYNGNRL